MQAELEELQPKLVVSAAENEKMMVVIEHESKEVAVTSEKVYCSLYLYCLCGDVKVL